MSTLLRYALALVLALALHGALYVWPHRSPEHLAGPAARLADLLPADSEGLRHEQGILPQPDDAEVPGEISPDPKDLAPAHAPHPESHPTEEARPDPPQPPESAPSAARLSSSATSMSSPDQGPAPTQLPDPSADSPPLPVPLRIHWPPPADLAPLVASLGLKVVGIRTGVSGAPRIEVELDAKAGFAARAPKAEYPGMSRHLRALPERYFPEVRHKHGLQAIWILLPRRVHEEWSKAAQAWLARTRATPRLVHHLKAEFRSAGHRTRLVILDAIAK